MQKASEILTSHNKFHINLGLERISKIMALLDNPQEKYQIVHIAGTNGKGSTSKIINEILIEHFKGKKNIGLFTSPHIFSYTERIKINNEDISEYIFDKLTGEIDKLAKENDIELSEFELITAVGFYYFYIKKVDFLVLETGLGGLFDATNIVSKSTSVITTIDFDHTERLGKTIEEIAIQKAGIIKEKSNVIISKENAGYETIKKTALEKNANLIKSSTVKVDFNASEQKNYAVFNNEKYVFNLLGKYQAQNLGLALDAVNSLNLNIQNETIKEALKKVSWRFRLEYNKEKNILIDAAHNPSGMKVLKDFLDENFKNNKKTFIFGCLKNKDYKKMFEILSPFDNKCYFYEFNYPNALTFNEFKKSFNNNEIKQISTIEEINEIIETDTNLKIFCGSIYMLGCIFNEIKF